MLLRPLRALAMVGAFCTFMPAGSVALATPDQSIEPTEVRGWLMRIHQAASTRNFQGTFIVSSSSSVSSAHIVHYYEGSNQYERIESLDGQARNVFRHNDMVYTLWPQSHVASIEQRGLLTSFPALLQAGNDHIAELYEMKAQGSDRVAGHEASVLLLRPRDATRFGYRLWADKETGLLLRADVLGEHGEILETSAFSDVSIGIRSQPEVVVASMKKLDGYKVVKPNLTPVKLEAEGWHLHAPVAGFKLVSCVMRPLEGPGGHPEQAPPASPALQAIFSDGLTYVSIFIEKFDADRHPQPMSTAIGATQTLMRRQDDAWITVMGDVPAATLRSFANSLERKK